MSTLHSLRTKLRRGENVCTFSRVRTQLSRKTQLPQHICGENWLSRPHPTHTASVASSCCLQLFFKERKINSKFHQRRLVELRGALLSPSAVIKKCCQWCSACVTTLGALSAQCPKALESAEWNTSPHQIGPPTEQTITLHEEKEKKQELCIRLFDEFLLVAKTVCETRDVRYAPLPWTSKSVKRSQRSC